MPSNLLHPDKGRPVRFAIVGWGKIARTGFVPAVKRTGGVQLAAVGTRRPSEVKTEVEVAADDTGVEVLHYRALLRMANQIDALYIAVPNHLHEEWAVAGAEAGLHILCEKPLAAGAAAAARCREVCRRHQVLLAEGFMYRHDPRHARVREHIAAGTIGEVSLLQVHFAYLLEDLNNIRLRRDCEGGALRDVGCYGIDLARLLFDAEPMEVTGQALWGEQSGVDEQSAIQLLFPRGRMAQILAATHLHREQFYRVFGTHGRIEVPDAFIQAPKGPLPIRICNASGTPTDEWLKPVDPFVAEIAAFANAIRRGDSTLPAPMEDGVANAKVLERAYSALEAGPRGLLAWHTPAEPSE